MANRNLSKAKKAKNDEFYTQLNDILKEMNAYLEYNPDVFRGKTVFCPCDDPEWSNFTRYFAQSFDLLGLKKLICTSFAADSNPYNDYYQPSLFETESPQYDPTKTRSKGKLFILTQDKNKDGKIDIDDLEWEYLQGDGDFRSEEVKPFRDEADFIITNPPFSLFREFLAWVTEANKQFSVIGSKNAITYKEIFPLIKDNRIWTGSSSFNTDMLFISPEPINPNDKPDTATRTVDGVVYLRSPAIWFTNIEHGRRHEPIPFMDMRKNLKYNRKIRENETAYKKYDNYNAIEVPITKAIPSDYDGVMGVPISFLDKYCPEQFEIVGMAQRECHNEFPDTKKYDGYVQMKSNGEVEGSNGKKIDEAPVIEGKIEGKTYYQNEQGRIVSSLYMRIFIRFKR